MFWFGVLRPGGNTMPSMVFDAQRLPMGFAFFTTEEKLDEYIKGQTSLVHVGFQLEKDMKVESYIGMIVDHFEKIFGDIEKAVGISMGATPVFLDPPVSVEGDFAPAYESLYAFFADKYPTMADRNFNVLSVFKHNGHTIAISKATEGDKQYVASIKRGEYNAYEEMQKAPVAHPADYHITTFYETQEIAEAAAKEYVDKLEELGMREASFAEELKKVQPKGDKSDLQGNDFMETGTIVV